MRTSLILLSMLAAFASRAEAAQPPNYEIIARLAQAPGNVTVTGSVADGVVWMLDNGMRSGVTPKLVG
ncbi:hypothetical protein [Methylocystis sp.]|uniref:hypothetical protein n=1 Tax=Methylocystis sp. TaxID=1911079 RepID=UPI003DA5238D